MENQQSTTVMDDQKTEPKPKRTKRPLVFNMEELKAKRWFTIEEAAFYSGMTLDALRKKVQRRQFPHNRPPNTRELKFDRLAIDRHYQRYAVSAVEEPHD